MRLVLCLLLAVCAVAAAAQSGSAVKVVPMLPGGAINPYYTANRAPLLAVPLTKLPLGAVEPAGWLKKQIDLMVDGMTGRLAEVSPWLKFEGSAWADPNGAGDRGWEELPYWLKGFTSMAYLSGNADRIAEARKWIDAILASQRPDGYFGPESNRTEPDLWPNMLALYAVRSHYEATNDSRIVPFLTKYCRWMAAIPRERYLPGSWQQIRGGDNLDVILWLYNVTGEPWLLDLARENHERTADWAHTIPTWHGVNLCQGFREPAQFFQQSRDLADLQATVRNYDTVMGRYGQVPGGMFGADENARPGYTGPRQGAETCSIAEIMYSHEMLLGITGDPLWADRCEEAAFNSLPASMTPDLKGLHYLTAPNQVQLDAKNKSPMIQNGGDMFSYSPFEQYRCCQHNVAFGWPYFVEHLWMATAQKGLAATLYAPCTVRTRVGDGTDVTVVESTGYPFRERVDLTLSSARPVRFPLALRIPGWCDAPKVRVNGRAVALPALPRGWIVVDRSWKSGDKVALELPMKVAVKTWASNRGAVSVSRGPLIYSLKIGERWAKYGANEKWPGWEVFPTTHWNYGLDIDRAHPTASISVAIDPKPISDQPFAPDAAPVVLHAKARKILGWTLEENGLVQELQPGPIRSSAPAETVTLVPMGCARLRISAFPQIGRGPDARDWGIADEVLSASHCNEGDTLSALTDGMLPRSSNDQTIPRFTWWNHLGIEEWVQIAFRAPRKVSSVEVYWFDDEPTGQCRTPASWKVLAWNGVDWKPVEATGPYGVAKDAFNRVTFAPAATTRLRIVAQLRRDFSGGLLEWRVR